MKLYVKGRTSSEIYNLDKVDLKADANGVSVVIDGDRFEKVIIPPVEVDGIEKVKDAQEFLNTIFGYIKYTNISAIVIDNSSIETSITPIIGLALGEVDQ